MSSSPAEGSSSNSIPEGSFTTHPARVFFVPSTARQDGVANRTRDENGNWTGETRQAIVVVAPVPIVPAAAPSIATDAAQSNAFLASVHTQNSLSHPMRMVEWQGRQPTQRRLAPQQPPIVGNAAQQNFMVPPPAFYPSAVAQPLGPQFGRGNVQADDSYRHDLPALSYLTTSVNSSLPIPSSPLMPNIPVYSPSHGFSVASPSHPMPPQVNPLNHFAGGRSAPPHFPRPFAPPSEQPHPMYPMFLARPCAFPQASSPNAQLLAIHPHGSAGNGWGDMQPRELPSSDLGAPLCFIRRAYAPDCSLPEVGRDSIDTRPVSAPAAAGFSASAGEQRQMTGVNGMATHGPSRSSPAAGIAQAAGSPASASHAVGAIASAAGSWRMQDGTATGWTPAAAQQVAGVAMQQAMLLAPSVVGPRLTIACPQLAPVRQQAGQQQQQQCLQGYVTAAPSQPWQQSFSPRQQLQQQHRQRPRRRQTSVATSSFGAAPAQVGHDPTPSAMSQTEGEQQRSSSSTVGALPQLQFDQNLLQHRRSSQTNSVARTASRSPSGNDAVQRIAESDLGLLNGSDTRDVNLSLLDITSDSEEAAYEPQHGSRLRTNSPAL